MRRIFTVSQLEAYARSPEEYRFKYELGIPSAQSALLCGTIIHDAIERLSRNPTGELQKIVIDACRCQGINPSPKELRLFLAPLRAFQQTALFTQLAKGKHELRFDWAFGNHLITGKIDWLLPTPSGLEVIDFKTDRIESSKIEQTAKNYELQMTAYALAVEAAKNNEVAQTTLVFLETKTSFSLPMTKERRQHGTKLIKEIMERILND